MSRYGDDVDDSTSLGTASFRFQWDVFLSFRGEDTRHNFTHRLYEELVQNGVRTFIDDEGLERGEEIAPRLVDAIQDSAAAIAVISERYADSRWCLEELAMIVECKRLLLPVFYKVDPSNVRRQKGPFEEDFRRLEERFGVERVVPWRKAFEKAGSISGWDSRIWEENEQELIQSLVKRVLNKLRNAPLGVAKYPVGLNSRLEELMMLIDVKSNGVRFLGIHGMGGAGKTTIAKALYNKLVVHFKRRSFVSNVRETARQENGLAILQNKLFADLSSRGTSQDGGGNLAIRELLHAEPVLVVLDDIDDVKQIDELAGKRAWFYEGSRIIITTRYKEAIPDYIVDRPYEMQMLRSLEALQLFSYHAFGKDNPPTEFLDLSKNIVSRTGGLPLALEVFGSFLFDKRNKKDWTEALKKLEQVRPGELQDILAISFNGLDLQEKCAFLDIACLFVQMKMKREDVIYMLKGYGFSGETVIRSLVAKSLIKVIEYDILWMHDQLRDMGRQIVQSESNDHGMRSRLWDNSDILNVLKNNKGTRSIEGIALDIRKTLHDPITEDNRRMSFKHMVSSATFCLKKMFKNIVPPKVENETVVVLHSKSFKPMVNLRFLHINNVLLSGSFRILPAELRCLLWRGCFLKSLPEDFRMQHLAVLDLSESKIEKPWVESWYNLQTWKKKAENLLVLNLQGCQHLTELPDFSSCSALEKLNLENCKALVNIHRSVGDLTSLLYLNLKECSNLTEFPSDVSGLKKLEILVLSGCLKLKELPDDMRSMNCLKELLIDETAIVKVPDSIFHLKKLERFSLKRCWLLKQLPPCIGKLSSLKELNLDSSGVEEIPDSIGSLTELETLNLMRCKSLTTLPDSIGNLKSLLELFLDYSSIVELPTSIGSLSGLKHLTVNHCKSLTILPDAIGGLVSLIVFQMEGTLITELPAHIGALGMVEKLDMRSCPSISFLPESIGKMLSMKTLILDKVLVTELPESIGMLERLDTLQINDCEKLHWLPASVGNLKSLRHLLMENTSISQLPHELGKLSSLILLKMGKKSDAQKHRQNTGKQIMASTSNAQQNSVSSVIPKSFSNLSSLQELNACAWKFSGEIPDEFENLSSMRNMNLSRNNFCRLPSSLRGLSILTDLNLSHCKEIKSLPPLPSSLVTLNIANCFELDNISDLMNLASLLELNLTNCNRIKDIPGLEYLKSLRRFYMGGCSTCFPAVKERLAKVALKHLFYFIIPGSTVPDWFVQEISRFSSPRNREIKGMIIGFVISLDQQTVDPSRNELPAIVDIRLEFYKQDDPKPVFTTVPYLLGVPDTSDDQLYMCRYYEFHKPVLMLKEGYRLRIAMRETPRFSGLQLKNHGIHLIFENDDFYEDDEESLPESHRSVSWKLAKFIGSLETNCDAASTSLQ